MHYFKDPFKSHGNPFIFTLKPGEMFSETKKRLFARLSIQSEREQSKIKFTFVTQGYGVSAIEDGDILHDRDFVLKDVIGLDHIDRTGKSSRPQAVTEKAIKIFN